MILGRSDSGTPNISHKVNNGNSADTDSTKLHFPKGAIASNNLSTFDSTFFLKLLTYFGLKKAI